MAISSASLWPRSILGSGAAGIITYSGGSPALVANLDAYSIVVASYTTLGAYMGVVRVLDTLQADHTFDISAAGANGGDGNSSSSSPAGGAGGTPAVNPWLGRAFFGGNGGLSADAVNKGNATDGFGPVGRTGAQQGGQTYYSAGYPLFGGGGGGGGGFQGDGAGVASPGGAGEPGYGSLMIPPDPSQLFLAPIMGGAGGGGGGASTNSTPSGTVGAGGGGGSGGGAALLFVRHLVIGPESAAGTDASGGSGGSGAGATSNGSGAGGGGGGGGGVAACWVGTTTGGGGSASAISQGGDGGVTYGGGPGSAGSPGQAEVFEGIWA